VLFNPTRDTYLSDVLEKGSFCLCEVGKRPFHKWVSAQSTEIASDGTGAALRKSKSGTGLGTETYNVSQLTISSTSTRRWKVYLRLGLLTVLGTVLLSSL